MNEPACCHQPGAYAAATDWPADVSRLLLDRLTQLGVGGRSVLEIGCGQGRLLIGLLLAGASRATGIDLDPEAIEEARERSRRAGVTDGIQLTGGDGLELELPPHDLVVLDRVICCDPDGEGLVRRSVHAARWAYALSVPESRGWRGRWNRLVYGVDAVRSWLFREQRVYLYDVRRLEGTILAAGLSLRRRERIGKWYVGLYVRADVG